MTMVNIPDEALQKAMRAAQTDSAEDVVVKALDEFSETAWPGIPDQASGNIRADHQSGRTSRDA